MTAARSVEIVLLLTGLFSLAFGLWAFVAPHSFYEQLAPFPPYSRHFLHDIGAFQIGIGAALLLALRWNDAQFVTLAGAGAGAGVHFLSHVIDHGIGGKDTDVPLFALLAVVLLVAATARWTVMKGSPPAEGR